MRSSLLILLGWSSACTPSPPDLTVPLAPGEVRAGVIVDEAVLWGGTAADGQVGDFLLINDRVRFVVQAARNDGHYYESVGGNVIDADLVRPADQPGRDSVDEWAGMYGLGRISRATSVEVVDDGVKSGEAIIRVTGEEASLGILTGTLENPTLVPDLGLTFVTDYILRPNTGLLEVRTSLTAGTEAVDVAPGDILQGGLESLQTWDPGVGLDGSGDDERRFTGYIGQKNELALAIVPPSGQTAASGAGSLLSSLADMLVTFQEPRSLAPGLSVVASRYYAVGRDMAAITDEVLALDGVPTRTESGVVTAPDGPVAGARVHILVDGEPFTVAFTDEEGAFAADVPATGDVSVRASGSLTGIFLDLPDGWGPNGVYATEANRALARSSLSEGAPVIPAAESRGLASETAPLTLAEPASLTVKADDNEPFEVFVYGDAGGVDPRFVSTLGGGAVALGWAADGEITLPVPAGDVRVEVHRGIQHERAIETLTLAAGEPTTLSVRLPKAYEAPGWLIGDPHSHAAPSPDGTVTMEERLAGTAAVGIDLHFGTDHDHIADYRGLIEPMGLGRHLRSVVANEVSPTLRGHMNVYPLAQVPDASNGGAVRWWETPIETTDGLVTQMRGMGTEVFVQANHPLSAGLASSAGWTTGRVGKPDRWSDQIDIIELNNEGNAEEVLPFYLDLITRGYAVTPTSVSDAHNAEGDGIGLHVTFIGVGSDRVGDYTDEALVEAFRARRTIASRGIFLETSVEPGSMLTEGTDLTVEALAPSWIAVDRVRLLRDGVDVEVVEGRQATFSLRPDADAVYVVIAEGDTPIGGHYGDHKPWAMTSPIWVNVDGGDWTPSKPPLVVE